MRPRVAGSVSFCSVTWIEHLKADRIAKADRVIGCHGGKTEAAMKVQLLMRRRLVCRAEIDHVLRTAALGKAPEYPT